jgi:subtilisin-like proprotein convertase family protein
MRLRSLLWFLVSLLCFAAAVVFWRMGDRWASRPNAAAEDGAVAAPRTATADSASPGARPRAGVDFRLMSEAGNLNRPETRTRLPNLNTNAAEPPRTAYRLSNTDEKVNTLARRPSAILLENALFDTSVPRELAVPPHLRAQGDPGAYIVQSRTALNNQFREEIRRAGADIVAYIPNQAYLVRASSAAARQLAAFPGTQAVLPYEPYYKIKSSLLRLAVESKPLPKNTALNLLLFSDARETTIAQLEQLGAEVVAHDRSPFGPVVRVRPPVEALSAIAALPGVQQIEAARVRVPANDLSRATLRVASDSTTNFNYLGLTGTNVLVNVNDTGVDAAHPVFAAGRVSGDIANSLVDASGHGTHVAGIIAGNGAESLTVSNARGSELPPVDGQFRGKAPGARIFSMLFSEPDWYLQEMAGRTNALISNNSWQYLRSAEYDLAAASYDAAVRDSVPDAPGSQPVLYVFPAGNAGTLSRDAGFANQDGLGGVADTIQSPGTAKNVITVGAVEQFRDITNETWKCTSFDGSTSCETNKPWQRSSDSREQVAGFSSRGNVGIGFEGEYGRFKPDLVAPGTFVVSARSAQWDETAYYNPTNYATDFMPDLQVRTNEFYSSGVFIPDNAVQLIIRAEATQPLGADLPILVGGNVIGTNEVFLPPDAPLAPINDFLDYQIGNATNDTVVFNLTTILVTTNENGNYFEVLSNLNNQLGPFYRYESGSSMAAASVSGTLALMHEFFTQRLGRTNSPALMKALLINGARSASDIYDFQVNNFINYQGWGLVNLPNSLPGALSNLVGNASSSPIFAFDQSPTNALASGQSETHYLSLSEGARNQPLRATLVWTDPPGNPVAGVKLVNDLDLVVTNLDTGEIYFGNDIRADNDFNLAWSTNNPPAWDFVNNVENVFLKEPLSTNYSVTVLARHVNVNAVTAHTNDVVQDFALVISSGNGDLTNALTLERRERVELTVPWVTVVTNNLPDNPEARATGGLLTGQHVGANTPLLGTNTIPLQGGALLTAGMTNQWHFYVLSNDLNFTNAAFVTFLPPTLAIPRMGVNEADPDNATRLEADIDLYVSLSPGLTNLDPAAIENAYKSQGRGGTEVIVLSNVAPAAVYYVGVKSEDQQAAEYNFLGIFSEQPFGVTDDEGNQYLLGLPVPAAIPPGTPQKPEGARILALSIQPITVRRVVVTNTLTHTFPGALVGTLGHNRKFAVLNNKTCATDPGTGNCITNTFDYIYEDNGEGDIPFARPADGPGNLKDFIGEEGLGVWLFNMANNFPAGTGVVNRLFIKLEPQNIAPGTARERDLLPNTWTYDSIDVPPQATNLVVCVSGNTDPIELYVARDYVPTRTTYDYKLDVLPPGDCLSITPFSLPPLTAGRYFIGVYNPSLVVQRIRLNAEVFLNPFAVAASIPSIFGGIPIKDDAVTYSTIFVTNRLSVSDLDVGLLIRHDRISDLAVTLISPSGTRVLLFENRGAGSTNGLGTFGLATNSAGVPVFASTNVTPFYTNDFEAAAIGRYAPGVTFQGWSVLSNFATVLPDFSVPWLSNRLLVLDDAVISNTLPTTNSTLYRLEFKTTHAPYLAGTVAWWPFDEDASDIFGGWNGLLSGGGDEIGPDTNNYRMFNPGLVGRAFYGDGVRAAVLVPEAPELNLAVKRGFSVEGWIKPANVTTGLVGLGVLVMKDGFENAVPQLGVGAGTNVSGWLVDSGDIDVLSSPPYPSWADSGANFIDLNGYGPGSISTNIITVPGRSYRLSFAYARNPDTLIPGFVGRAAVSLSGQPDLVISYDFTNSVGNLAWARTSHVFTASSPVTTLRFASLNSGNGGMFIDSVEVAEAYYVEPEAAPLAEWYKPSDDPTNEPLQGVQFWVGGVDRTNYFPGALAAVIWNTNDLSYPVLSVTNAITNGGWQHVAMTFDNATKLLSLYANGNLLVSQAVGPADAVARTLGNFYLGYHPGSVTNLAAFRGGMDEFGLYERPLSPCEVAAIHAAGKGGKYGTNVLSCPITNSIELITSAGSTVYHFTNGLTWTNGPRWETVAIDFSNPLLSASSNGPGTNLTSIVVRPRDPNVALDDFVLSAVTSNFVNGLLHFTEDTNVARIPIKFAPWPFALTNFPPTVVFSNDFENATQGVYQAGSLIRGGTNSDTVGVRDWTVVSGPVSVISNSLVDTVATNWVALSRGAIACELPTVPGRRYQLTYAVRGPGAVGWWNGDLEPLSDRARDLIGGNHGAFIALSTNHATRLVGSRSLYFNGWETNGIASKLELADPDNLRLTNQFSIEGWIRPIRQTNYFGTEQIFFRGDSRACLDPFYLALDPVNDQERNLRFHIEDGASRTCGVDVFTTNAPIAIDRWQHVAAVFEPCLAIPEPPFLTNQLRLYIDGQLVATNYTGIFPFRDLDPAFSPGVSIGNRSRYDVSQPFRGFLDELSIYGRALTEAEIKAIHAAGGAGKADLAMPPAQSLAKLRVLLDNVQMDIGFGDNARWTTRTITFTANRTNMVLNLEGLLPSTLVNDIALTEIPAELSYLPEESLEALIGEDAYGLWTLEILDTRADATNNSPELVQWQLDFRLIPGVQPQPVFLSHGILYTNTLTAGGSQSFVVVVPPWAVMATNLLQFATNRVNGGAMPLSVFFDTNGFPTNLTGPPLIGPASSGLSVLTTNPLTPPFIISGQTYYLTVTNPNPLAATFAVGVWFDITSLTNCLAITNFVGPAGIPRYFQIDVPTNDVPPEVPRDFVFWLSGVQSNVTVVLNQHLPLPDLSNYDYISRANSTNDEVLMVLTNTTPFPLQTNRWYIGVFNSEATNVPFTVQACYSVSTNDPALVRLTNNLPCVVSLTNQFVAPPGPPRWFFYQFPIHNYVDAVLFELYDMSGDVDLVLQRDRPSAMAPYFDGSFQLGLEPEQIVLRTSFELPDLRGDWYLGVYNNELTNVTYSIRAHLQQNGILTSVFPLTLIITPTVPPGAIVLQWNAVEGEIYVIERTDRIRPSNWKPVTEPIVATTPTPAIEIPIQGTAGGFYRVVQRPRYAVFTAPLRAQRWSGNLIRISWPTTFVGYTLQYSIGLNGIWQNANLPVTIEGNEYVAYEPIGAQPKFFRLIP